MDLEKWRRKAWHVLREKRVANLDADDLVQMVIEKLLSTYPGVRLGDMSAALIFTVMRRTAIDHLRSGENRFVVRAEAEPRPATVYLRTVADYDWVEVDNVLARLRPEERCFLFNVVFEEITVGQAQRECGWPPMEKSPYYYLRILLARVKALLSGVARKRGLP